MDTSPFGDWKVRLGVVLGVLCFAGQAVYTARDADPAWNIILFVTLGALGASVVSDYVRK